jgi:hypothetical protein
MKKHQRRALEHRLLQQRAIATQAARVAGLLAEFWKPRGSPYPSYDRPPYTLDGLVCYTLTWRPPHTWRYHLWKCSLDHKGKPGRFHWWRHFLTEVRREREALDRLKDALRRLR